MTDKANSQHQAPESLYFGAVDAGFGNGVRIDIRARLANDFLKAGMFARPTDLAHALGMGPVPNHDTNLFSLELARRSIEFALNLGEEFIAQAEKRGLLKDLPESGELTAHDRVQLERQVRSQLWSQHCAQRIQREEADRIATPPPGLARA